MDRPTVGRGGDQRRARGRRSRSPSTSTGPAAAKQLVRSSPGSPPTSRPDPARRPRSGHRSRAGRPPGRAPTQPTVEADESGLRLGRPEIDREDDVRRHLERSGRPGAGDLVRADLERLFDRGRRAPGQAASAASWASSARSREQRPPGPEADGQPGRHGPFAGPQCETVVGPDRRRQKRDRRPQCPGVGRRRDPAKSPVERPERWREDVRASSRAVGLTWIGPPGASCVGEIRLERGEVERAASPRGSRRRGRSDESRRSSAPGRPGSAARSRRRGRRGSRRSAWRGPTGRAAGSRRVVRSRAPLIVAGERVADRAAHPPMERVQSADLGACRRTSCRTRSSR